MYFPIHKKFTGTSDPHRDPVEGKAASQLTFIEHLLHIRLSDLFKKKFNFVFYNNKLMKSSLLSTFYS